MNVILNKPLFPSTYIYNTALTSSRMLLLSVFPKTDWRLIVFDAAGAIKVLYFCAGQSLDVKNNFLKYNISVYATWVQLVRPHSF